MTDIQDWTELEGLEPIHEGRRRAENETAALRARIAELEARAEATQKRLADAKAAYEKQYHTPSYQVNYQEVAREMEHIVHSAMLYLDGERGPYRPEATSEERTVKVNIKSHIDPERGEVRYD